MGREISISPQSCDVIRHESSRMEVESPNWNPALPAYLSIAQISPCFVHVALLEVMREINLRLEMDSLPRPCCSICRHCSSLDDNEPPNYNASLPLAVRGEFTISCMSVLNFFSVKKYTH